MKTLLALFVTLLCLHGAVQAQTTCNPNGNIVLFTNYDGGTLNINVDVNIPNIKIGVVTYEAVSINLTGAYVGNVTEVRYAGYNSNNTNCSPSVTTTTISGAPTSAQTSITFAPPATLSNSNGYNSIICAYSCSTTSNQGGCNTIDQIHAYWLNVFSGSTIRMNKTQYNCWSGTQTVSGGGNCCPVVPLSGSTSTVAPSCNGSCNGSVTVAGVGGTAPYTYQWAGGPTTATWSNRCPGTYTVTVTDATNATATASVTVVNPPIKQSTQTQTACVEYFFNGMMRTVSGTYMDTLQSGGCDSFLTLNLTINPVNIAVNQSGATLTAAATGAAYKWVRCPSYAAIAGATTSTYTATANGQYAVIVTQNGCSDTSACRTVSGLGVAATGTKSGLRLYPNPAESGVLYVETPPALRGQAYQLVDGSGRTVLSGQLGNTHTTTINIAALPAGMYTLRVSGAEDAVRIVR